MRQSGLTVRHFPWPVPACLGACAAAASVFSGPAAGAAWLILGLAFTALQPRPREALLFLILGFSLVFLRGLGWQARPDPLAGLDTGSQLVLEGVSDGQVLEVSAPARLRLWLSPAGAVPAGRVRVSGQVRRAEGVRNPGGFDFQAHLERRGIAGQFTVAELLEWQPARSLRSRLVGGLTAGLPQEQAALLAALSLGERTGLGDLRELFQQAGLAHILALSGLHLSVLAGAAAKLLGGTRGYRRPVLIILVAGFTALAGATPSLLRAAFMTSAYLLAEAAGRGRAEGFTVLCLSATASLAWRPVWLYDLSFQLSYLALLGLLAAAPGISRLTRQLPPRHPRRFLLTGLLASSAAQLPTASLVAGTFHALPFLSLVTNLVAVPLAALLVPLALLSAVLGALWEPLALPLKLAAGPLTALLMGVARLGAHLPQLPWADVTASGHLYWAAASAALFLLFTRGFRPVTGMTVLACALLASLLTPSGQPAAELLALDVGQGDAFLLRVRGGANVLIDAGGNARGGWDPGERVVVPALRALGVTRLDLLVMTHADADHAGGLPAVLEHIPVQTLVIGTPEPDRPAFARATEAALLRGVEIRTVQRGETLRLGRLALEVLNPGPHPGAEANDDSVALNVWLDGRPVAVMPAEVPAGLEEILAFAPADVLTVPHHGSRFSSSDALLRKVGGRTAVISVGTNNYGHPHPDVLGRLAAHGYTVLTTREAGAVSVILGESRPAAAW